MDVKKKRYGVLSPSIYCVMVSKNAGVLNPLDGHGRKSFRWETNPSEKYAFVSWDFVKFRIPDGNNKTCFKQPSSFACESLCGLLYQSHEMLHIFFLGNVFSKQATGLLARFKHHEVGL